MTTPELPTFPPGFVLGAATASYQIEGAVAEDGRTASVWDTFSRTPGKTLGGATGDVACDHYHRYREDVALLADLGVDSYRFSIAWPRVQPGGRGPVNPAGVGFYDRLVDELLSRGIDPAVTLYHWDLPQELEDAGGWRTRDTAHRFAEFSRLVADALGDRVTRWITLNEPWCAAFLGYANGHHAPGAQEGTPALAAAHHLLLGHGLAVPQLREAGAREVGITLNLDQVTPASDSEADRAAALRALTHHNLVWTEPLLAGRYPDSERETWGELADGSYRRDGDLEVIGAPIDFLGINYYTPAVVAAAPHDEPDPAKRTAMDIGTRQVERPELRHTTMGWPVDPPSLGRLIADVTQRYPDCPPLWITENGSAETDAVGEDGVVHDTDRVEYLAGHLAAVAEQIERGADVRGYYVWSLMDNFEWAFGYERRFGIVHVDYDTQVRTPKDSYRWFQRLTAAQRAARTDATEVSA
ncbi:GH1 family beta-glucosidase [Paenibacillus sp. TRM 82003]|uniref:GH1 family beta-glucosidase n=1 Tax=Kineococcus sp. TRM81007 TaxID=2925831 RepID=UPI001F584B03|nr:GH1 family beta-glucosidase [Kineococcus sp. TRM81007]MCI2237118.1 GH1 family beta-glucosidase [Kineococcus sp. TRM81007]MCI3926411.1 GH1 family beta-glucosidase [Paenibacillus sp. TRM 82003]